MTPEHAKAVALAYAWGMQDGTRRSTYGGSEAFADAYVKAREDFELNRSQYMPGLATGYSAWQETGGRTVIP